MLQTGNAAPVNKVLGNLNKYLNEKAGTKFLLKDTPTYADCQLLPKLQHLRVAAKVSESSGVVSPKTYNSQDDIGLRFCDYLLDMK